MKSFYFISGLPRSGSILLSAILKQNPDFYADIASPVQGIVTNTIDFMTGCESNLNLTESRRKDLILSLTNLDIDFLVIGNYIVSKKTKKTTFSYK